MVCAGVRGRNGRGRSEAGEAAGIEIEGATVEGLIHPGWTTKFRARFCGLSTMQDGAGVLDARSVRLLRLHDAIRFVGSRRERLTRVLA